MGIKINAKIRVEGFRVYVKPIDLNPNTCSQGRGNIIWYVRHADGCIIRTRHIHAQGNSQWQCQGVLVFLSIRGLSQIWLQVREESRKKNYDSSYIFSIVGT
jgi:hypothetical protein